LQRNEEKEGGFLLTGGASGSITNDQRSSSLCLTALRLMARLTHVAACDTLKFHHQINIRNKVF
jgi:hypothetical protein